MSNNILEKVTKPQHASVHNKVSRVKNLEGGGAYMPPPAQIGLTPFAIVVMQPPTYKSV